MTSIGFLMTVTAKSLKYEIVCDRKVMKLIDDTNHEVAKPLGRVDELDVRSFTGLQRSAERPTG